METKKKRKSVPSRQIHISSQVNNKALHLRHSYIFLVNFELLPTLLVAVFWFNMDKY